jgi:phosphohistidine phosphatase
MKTLYLVRHAKASRDEKEITDWERPLTPAGIQRATIVGKKLRSKKVAPEKIISSYAFRALNTALIFAAQIKYPLSAIDIEDRLYMAKTSDTIDMLKKQDDSVKSIMLFGHNPGISNLCNHLTRKKGKELATSEVVCIEFTTDSWSNIAKYTGKLVFTESGKRKA